MMLLEMEVLPELFNELVLLEFVSDTLKPPILNPPDTTWSSVSFNSTGSSAIKVSIIFPLRASRCQDRLEGDPKRISFL